MARSWAGCTGLATVVASLASSALWALGPSLTTSALAFVAPTGGNLIWGSPVGPGRHQALALFALAFPPLLGWVIAAVHGRRRGLPSGVGTYLLFTVPILLCGVVATLGRLAWMRAAWREAVVGAGAGGIQPWISGESLDHWTRGLVAQLAAALASLFVALVTSRRHPPS